MNKKQQRQQKMLRQQEIVNAAKEAGEILLRRSRQSSTPFREKSRD